MTNNALAEREATGDSLHHQEGETETQGDDGHLHLNLGSDRQLY